MEPKIVLITLVIFTVILESKSDMTCKNCRYRMPEYTRTKRAKYYGPQRFYRQPPISFPTKGAFSYTPPPGYMMEDEEKYPANFKPKVSKRPSNDGLGDEDINNLVKYLSKKDLDKIIEFAGGKERYTDNRDEYKRPDFNGHEIDDHQKFSFNDNHDQGPFKTEYVNPNIKDQAKFSYQDNPNVNYINEATQPKILYTNPPDISPFSNQKQMSFLNQDAKGSIYTDSTVMREETLPKPSNLRDDEYEVSFTNNVPKIVKSESSSYKLENFGDLPLMNYYDSKLHSVSSYNVPHYTVTSPKTPSPQSSSSQVPLELASAGATGHDQSDAHLKAIKIWTHKSKGTAYTLHDDGTLSLERPKTGGRY